MKYIVSTFKMEKYAPNTYNHDAVKLAYKAGAVVEVLFESQWHTFTAVGPSFLPENKYRAIVTADMPKEIQDLVNWTEQDKAEANTKRHKWADVIIAMANGEKIQYLNVHENWVLPVLELINPISHPAHEWRVRPRTIMIGDIEIPAPETQEPAHGTQYYAPDLLEEQRLYLSYDWKGDSLDKHILASRLLHLSAKNAQEHALALIKVNGGQHPNDYEVVE